MAKILETFKRVKCEPAPLTWDDVPEGELWVVENHLDGCLVVMIKNGGSLRSALSNGQLGQRLWFTGDFRPIRPLNGPAPDPKPVVLVGHERWEDMPERVEFTNKFGRHRFRIDWRVYWYDDGGLPRYYTHAKNRIDEEITPTGYRIEATWTEE